MMHAPVPCGEVQPDLSAGSLHVTHPPARVVMQSLHEGLHRDPGAKEGPGRAHILRDVFDVPLHLAQPGRTRAFTPMHTEELQKCCGPSTSNLAEKDSSGEGQG